MQHPDLRFVQGLIDSLMGEHRLADCHLKGVRYDSYSSTYTLVLTKDEKMIDLKIPCELFEKVQANPDSFSKRKIKALLKDAIAVNKFTAD